MNSMKLSLGSIALDLKRVSLGYHRGSTKMADRFLEEALKRRNDINLQELDPYIRKLLQNMGKNLKNSEQTKLAEDALMYSVLLQNYVQKRL